MKAFSVLTSRCVPMDAINIDTDQIIPSRFLRFSRKDGYGQFFFRDLRLTTEGAPKPDFVLNQEVYAGARIMVANHNFGCGSSREGAVFALADYGFQCVIAPSFGEIFFNNCFKNGVLPIRLSDVQVSHLLDRASREPEKEITIDLRAQTIVAEQVMSFEVDPFWKECLLLGIDDISFTLKAMDQIQAFERRYHAQMPWLRSVYASAQQGAKKSQ